MPLRSVPQLQQVVKESSSSSRHFVQVHMKSRWLKEGGPLELGDLTQVSPVAGHTTTLTLPSSEQGIRAPHAFD